MPKPSEVRGTTDREQFVKTFLEGLLDSEHEALITLLADDAVMEFPYALPNSVTRLDGRPEIVKFLSWFRDFLQLTEVKHVATHWTANLTVIILEYEGAGRIVQTGRSYHQKYISVLTVRDGRISHWKDYWNPVSVLVATGDLSSVIGKSVNEPGVQE